MTTLTYSEVLRVQHCYTCGVAFAMPTDLDDTLQENHKNFYCPLGHSQSYVGKTEAQKQRERAEQAERRAERAEASRQAAWDQADAAERRRRAAKGQLTKTRKRIANGVCPCCNRTFPNLADHMATKHPDYVETPT